MSTSDQEEAARRAALEARIVEVRQGSGDAAPQQTSLGMAARVGSELVAALVVGFVIGWALDSWFGTKPFLMFLFVFVGIGAGMMNVYRAMNGGGSAIGIIRRGMRGSQQLRGEADGAGEKNAMVGTSKHGHKRD